jgi:hypothetical protein
LSAFAARIHPWALVPDPRQAREWLGQELSRPDYQESWVERFNRWLSDLLDKVSAATSHAGQLNPVLAAAIAVALVGLCALALSRLRRNPTVQQHGGAVFAEVRESAQQHRQAAHQALDQGRWGDAVVESVRALAAGLVERGLVPEQADVTVHELTENAAALYPGLGSRLRQTGVAFDETKYGDRPADEDRAVAAVALEDEVSRRRPEQSGSRPPVSAVPR